MSPIFDAGNLPYEVDDPKVPRGTRIPASSCHRGALYYVRVAGLDDGCGGFVLARVTDRDATGVELYSLTQGDYRGERTWLRGNEEVIDPEAACS